MRKEILSYIETHSRVELKELAVYLISGGYDLLVTLEGKTLKEVSMFVSEKLSPIESVISTATHFILKKYKDHSTILVNKSKGERIPVMP